jgi:nucleotide-binding universal stress UspA family protein
MTNTSKTILACVDGSHYTDSVCAHADWASRQLNVPIWLLHIQAPHGEQATVTDYSGSIGVGEVGALLEKLSLVDEARGTLDQHKGELILEHAKKQLAGHGHTTLEAFHRRGSLVETLTELERSIHLIVLGKRGEHADFAKLHLGSNLERVVRAARTPVLVCSRDFKAITSFVIAYDGGQSAGKAVDYIAKSPLLKGLECHLLQIGQVNAETQRVLDIAAAPLKQNGFSVQTHIAQGRPDEVIAAYIERNAIRLLAMGAYGHSRLRTLFIGSTTSAMLRSNHIPVLLFR